MQDNEIKELWNQTDAFTRKLTWFGYDRLIMWLSGDENWHKLPYLQRS